MGKAVHFKDAIQMSLAIDALDKPYPGLNRKQRRKAQKELRKKLGKEQASILRIITSKAKSKIESVGEDNGE